MSNFRKRIPYGMMNFVDIRKDNCYFVDKTRFIPAMEQANKFFFFIRPRRFGKSLTISMLKHYYDVLTKPAVMLIRKQYGATSPIPLCIKLWWNIEAWKWWFARK